MGGVKVLTIASCFGAALTVVCIGYGSKTVVAPLVFVLTPTTLWLSFASIDGLALGIFSLGLLSNRLVFSVTSSLLHLQLIPFVAIQFFRRRRGYSILGVGIGFTLVMLLMMATPYSTLIYKSWAFREQVTIVPELWFTLLIMFFVALVSRNRAIIVLGCILALWECGIQNHANPRYFLPVLVMACITMKPVREWRVSHRQVGARLVRTRDGRRWNLDEGGVTNSRLSRDNATRL